MSERIKVILTGFDQLSQEEVKTELPNGELDGYPILPPKPPHGPSRATLVLFLSAFVKARNLGRVFSENTTVTLGQRGETDKSNALALGGGTASPDILFVSFEQLPDGTWLDSAPRVLPDLVIEFAPVAEPIDMARETVKFYLDRGVPWVWLLLPDTHEILTFSPGNRDGVRLIEADDLRGEGLLVGFSVPIRAIFDEDMALQADILRKLITT